jgi:uncharacterized repeat protein (TIGR01451 family)
LLVGVALVAAAPAHGQLEALDLELRAPERVAAGGSLRYEVAVIPLPLSLNEDLEIHLFYPPGLPFLATSCPLFAAVPGRLECHLDRVEDSPVLFTVDLAVPPEASPGLVVARAEVVAGDCRLILGEPPLPIIVAVPCDDVAEATTTLEAAADLRVVPLPPGTADAGLPTTFGGRLLNAGPSIATGVELAFALPSELTFLRPALGSDCQESAGMVVCELGPLAPGQVADAFLETQVDASATRNPIPVTLTASSPTSDPMPADNQALLELPLRRRVDLGLLAAAADPSPATAGETVTLTAVVRSTGPATATGAAVTVTLPPELTFDAPVSTPPCVTLGGPVSCNLPVLAAGDQVSVSFRARVADTTDRSPLPVVFEVRSAEIEIAAGDNTFQLELPVRRRADLALVTATADRATAGAGLPLGLRAIVRNLGPSTAGAAEITITLPAGVAFTSAGPGSTCIPAAGMVRCPLGPLAPQTEAAVDLTVVVSPEVTANPLQIQFDSFTADLDVILSNNRQTLTLALERQADAALGGLTDSPDPVLAGDLLRYSMTVSNQGPASATGMELTANLPAVATFDPLTSDGRCGVTGSALRCVLGNLGAGASTAVTVGVRSQPPPEPALSVAFQLTARETDPEPGNNQATAVTVVQPRVDLALTKTALGDPVQAGGTVTYQLTVQNHGASAAAGALVLDQLPPGTAYLAASGAALCAGDPGGMVRCEVGPLAAGVQTVVFLQAAVLPDAPATLLNRAQVTTVGNDADVDATNDQAEATVTVEHRADLELATFSAAPVPATAGGELTVAATLVNGGPAQAPGAELVVSLPGGVGFLSATPAAVSCTALGSTVRCALGDLAPAVSVPLELRLGLSPDLRGTLILEGRASSTAADPQASNNGAQVAVAVAASAGLTLAAAASPDPVVAGEVLLLRSTVANGGPSTATEVAVTTTLPAGLTFLGPPAPSPLPDPAGIFSDGFESGDLSAWDAVAGGQVPVCAAAAGVVTCTVGALGPGRSALVSFTARVAGSASGSLEAPFETTAAEADPDLSDNQATAAVTVTRRRIDLAVTLADAPDPVPAGGALTYQAQVGNTGPATASGVTLTVFLPVESTLISTQVVGLPGSCAPVTEGFRCDLAELAPGTGVLVTAQTRVAAGATGFLTCTAQGAAREVDADPVNDRVTAVTEVAP